MTSPVGTPGKKGPATPNIPEEIQPSTECTIARVQDTPPHKYYIVVRNLDYFDSYTCTWE